VTTVALRLEEIGTDTPANKITGSGLPTLNLALVVVISEGVQGGVGVA
jgi:hypothetical protein